MGELGQTHDPRALLPGDPAVIRDNARVLRARAGHAEKAGDGLVDIDTGAWTGQVADAFRDRFRYEPGRWYDADDSLATGADALDAFAGTLEWAQGRGRDVLVPLALAVVERDPLAEGDFYPGDLLSALLRRVPEEYWRAHPDQAALCG